MKNGDFLLAMLVYQRVDVIDAYPHSHEISDSQLL